MSKLPHIASGVDPPRQFNEADYINQEGFNIPLLPHLTTLARAFPFPASDSSFNSFRASHKAFPNNPSIPLSILQSSWFSYRSFSSPTPSSFHCSSSYIPPSKSVKHTRVHNGKEGPSNEMIRSRKIAIRINRILRGHLSLAYYVTRSIYNECVYLCTRATPRHPVKHNDLRKLLIASAYAPWSAEKRALFNEVPADVRHEAIKDFCKAFVITMDKVNRKDIPHFRMHFRSRKYLAQESIVIRSRDFKDVKEGQLQCYPSKWRGGLIRSFNDRLPSAEFITKSVRLIRTKEDKYYIALPLEVKLVPSSSLVPKPTISAKVPSVVVPKPIISVKAPSSTANLPIIPAKAPLSTANLPIIPAKAPLLVPKPIISAKAPLLVPKPIISAKAPLLVPKPIIPAKAPLLVPKPIIPAKAPLLVPKPIISAKAPSLIPKRPIIHAKAPKPIISAKAPSLIPKRPIIHAKAPKPIISAKAPSLIPKLPIIPAKAPSSIPKLPIIPSLLVPKPIISVKAPSSIPKLPIIPSLLVPKPIIPAKAPSTLDSTPINPQSVDSINKRKEFNQPTRTEKILRGNAVALDPGVRIFQTTYDTEGNSYLIGENGAKKIDSLAGIARRMRAGIYRYYQNGKKKYRKARNSKERRGLLKAANRIEQRIKNMISDIHRKTVKFLCEKYDTIIIPEFASQDMVRDVKRKIGKSTARQLLRWSHYKFRELLKCKGEVMGAKVIIGTEEYTSKTCGNCFYVNKHLTGQKTLLCRNCNVKIHRDINGARNILMLNWHKAHLQGSLSN